MVLAVPHEAAARLIPPGALPDATVAGWAGLGASPIVNVHVIYDRPVTDLPFAAAIDSPVQWVFDRTRISGLGPRGSPAPPRRPERSTWPSRCRRRDEYVDVPAAALREQFVPALAELFPAAREAQVTEFFVTRERRATFRQAPGTARLRPAAATNCRAWSWRARGPHRMAGHHGERRAQRPGRRDRAPPHSTLRPRTFPSPGCPAPDRIQLPGWRIFRFRTFRFRSERIHLNDGGTSVTAVMPEGVALARDLVGPAMESAIGRLTPDVRVVAAYHLGFADAEGNPTRGGSGKALRPALALLSARAAGAPPERGVTAAVAVELVHNCSLLHDDIMDNDTERRHRPTAWTVFGVGAAILASASSASPARMAAPTPCTVQAVGRCRRSVSPSMMSSCSNEKLCTSSTATAAGTPRSGAAPAARADSRAARGAAPCRAACAAVQAQVIHGDRAHLGVQPADGRGHRRAHQVARRPRPQA